MINLLFIALICSIYAGIKYKRIFFCLTLGFILLFCKQYLGRADMFYTYLEKTECCLYMIFFYIYSTLKGNDKNESNL